MGKGQVSVEFLVILAVALLALLVFLMLSQEETVLMGQSKIRHEATYTVNELGAAAKEVYAQGLGARKKVMITIPFGYEPDESFVGKQAIKLHVAGSDYVATEEFDMHGSLPRTSGRHTVWLISEGESVRVHTAMIATDTEAINLIMGRNDTRGWTFNLMNTWNSSLDVTINAEWGHTDVSMAIDKASFTLTKGSSIPLVLEFSSAPLALGFYPGSLNITAFDGSETESTIIPISVEVSPGKGAKEGPPLMIIPSFVDAEMSRDSTTVHHFQVCTNSETSVAYVDFAGSPGEPGDWIGNNESLGPIGTGHCMTKSLSINVPLKADLGNFSGYVYATSDIPGAEDAIAIGVLVGGSPYDTQGPLVRAVHVFPDRRKFQSEPVVIMAEADDIGRGDNPLESCDLSIDNGPWYQMIATDGIYNEIDENASYAFFDGFGSGTHTASVRCTDAKNNTGEAFNQTFRVMKEFLLITESGTPDTQEQAWVDWIETGHSSEGYVWNIDSAGSAEFSSGAYDISDYAVLLVEKWVDASRPRLEAFALAGGSVVFLGDSLADAPYGLGLSVQAGNPTANDTYVDIVAAHYITQGYSGETTMFFNVTEQGRFWKDMDGTLLARSPTGSPPHYHVLGISGNYYFWGPIKPQGLSFAGMEITGRTLDHAINASAIGAGG